MAFAYKASPAPEYVPSEQYKHSVVSYYRNEALRLAVAAGDWTLASKFFDYMMAEDYKQDG